VDNNLNRADRVLYGNSPEKLDVLILPELVFLGGVGNPDSVQKIKGFLEPTASGKSSLWARTTALKYKCAVVVGYGEVENAPPAYMEDKTVENALTAYKGCETVENAPPAWPKYYNSVITVNKEGYTIANYRKPLLFDETWPVEKSEDFFNIEGLGIIKMGLRKWPR
jgi:protein N-terminal amidase